jgi:porin
MNECKYFIVALMAPLLSFYSYAASAIEPSTTATAPIISETRAPAIGISSNPAAVNITTGSGVAQRYINQLFGIKNDHGVLFGGAWTGDINRLFSGGISHPVSTTTNSLLQFDLTIDTEKFNGWKGGLFGAEFLQINAQNTNFQAGTVQGYNSIPGPPPLNRSELYQLWYRQTFFDDKFILRIGKTVPTYDFANVVKPVALSKGSPTIPAVSGLIFTPIFINPSMLGTMPGYYNSAYGITMSFAPIKQWYLSYGIYDGNLARGEQTGLHGTPTFNGAHFQIAETGVTWLLGKKQLPGTIGTGVWYQHGKLQSPPTVSENNTAGFYLFGSQRLWYKHPGVDNSGISAFYQYGFNKSRAMLMTKNIGTGLTAFGLVPRRRDDSFGVGATFAWMNKNIFNHQNELLLQAYYQAKIISDIYLEPAISYIPTPAANATSNNAWAGTLRVIVLF